MSFPPLLHFSDKAGTDLLDQPPWSCGSVLVQWRAVLLNRGTHTHARTHAHARAHTHAHTHARTHARTHTMTHTMAHIHTTHTYTMTHTHTQ